jgi:hypothetical protein
LAAQQEIDPLVKIELDGPVQDIPPVKVSMKIPGLSASASNVYQDNPDYGADKAFDDDASPH